MRFELRRLTDYSDDAILSEIRRVAEMLRQPTLSRSEFRSILVSLPQQSIVILELGRKLFKQPD